MGCTLLECITLNALSTIIWLIKLVIISFSNTWIFTQARLHTCVLIPSLLYGYLSFDHSFIFQVKAAVAALRNTRGLNWPASFDQQRQQSGELDVLDWLRAMFGFQARVLD